MLSNRLTRTSTERTEMFRAESLELLARRRPRLRDQSIDQEGGARAPLVQEKSRTVPADDPDDCGPRLSVTFNEQPVAEIYALMAAQAEQTSGRSDAGEQSTTPQSPPRATAGAAGASTPPDLLDPMVLRTMPPRVAAFMLYEPPRWRTNWPPEGMDDRAWCG